MWKQLKRFSDSKMAKGYRYQAILVFNIQKTLVYFLVLTVVTDVSKMHVMVSYITSFTILHNVESDFDINIVLMTFLNFPLMKNKI